MDLYAKYEENNHMELVRYCQEHKERFGSYEDLVAIIASKLSTLITSTDCEVKSLSNYTGISLSSLHKLKRGEGNPTISNIFKIANYFGVPIGFFFTADESEIKKTSLKSFPVYDLDTFGISKSKANIFIKESQFDNVDYTIRINTTVYAPIYQPGVILYISKESIIESGDIVFVASKNGNALRRVLHVNSKSVYISIDASSNIDDTPSLKVYGKVLGVSI